MRYDTHNICVVIAGDGWKGFFTEQVLAKADRILRAAEQIHALEHAE